MANNPSNNNENDFLDQNLHIDIMDYWLILQKRFVHILLVFVLVLIAVVTYTYKQPPVYQATCKIKISTRQPMATMEGAQITWYGSKGNEISSEIKLISNKTSIMKKVLEVLKAGKLETVVEANDYKEYYNPDDVDTINNIIFSTETLKFVDKLTIGSLKGLISIDPVPQSDILEIKVKGPYKDFTIAAANVIAMVYKADFVKSKILEAKNTMDFIAKQLENLKKELENTKSKIKKVSEQNTFLGDASVYQTELTNLRIQLDKLKEKYQPKHPRIIKIKKSIKSLEEQLAKFPQTKQEYDDNLSDRKSKLALRQTLGEHLITAKINYAAKKEKAKDEIQIIAKATYASKLSPKTDMNIFIGALFGIILACISALVWEGLDTSIGKIEDVERITRLPVIAHIPMIGKKTTQNRFFKPIKIIWAVFIQILFSILHIEKKEPPVDFENRIIFNFDSLSVESEAYRTLRTNIHFAIGSEHEGGDVIAITSTSPREGKTLTSTNLAIGLAQMGKMTLLLEADMRCPQVASIFKIDEKPGLSDLLIGTAKREQAVRTITDILMGDSEWDVLMETQNIDNLHILPCGTIPPNPSELLISPDFKDRVEEFRKEYDFIIIDTPPILPVSDASIVGQIVDGTLLIYQSDKTSRHLLLRAIQTLKKNDAKLLGIVINQLSFDVIMNTQRGDYAYGYRRRPSNA